MHAAKRCAPAFSFPHNQHRDSMDSKERTFRVSMGKAAKRLTAAYFAVLLIVFGASYVSGVYDKPTPLSLSLNGSVAAILAVTTLWCYWLSPKQLDVSGEWLTIERRIGRKRIAIRDIIHIERYGGMGGDMRVCGVGGVFGFTGWFLGRQGKYFAYVGDCHDTVMVTTARRSYLVSCDSPDELVTEVRKLIGGQAPD